MVQQWRRSAGSMARPEWKMNWYRNYLWLMGTSWVVLESEAWKKTKYNSAKLITLKHSTLYLYGLESYFSAPIPINATYTLPFPRKISNGHSTGDALSWSSLLLISDNLLVLSWEMKYKISIDGQPNIFQLEEKLTLIDLIDSSSVALFTSASAAAIRRGAISKSTAVSPKPLSIDKSAPLVGGFRPMGHTFFRTPSL